MSIYKNGYTDLSLDISCLVELLDSKTLAYLLCVRIFMLMTFGCTKLVGHDVQLYCCNVSCIPFRCVLREAHSSIFNQTFKCLLLPVAVEE